MYKMQPITYRCYNSTNNGGHRALQRPRSVVVLVWVAVAADRIKKVLSACLAALARKQLCFPFHCMIRIVSGRRNNLSLMQPWHEATQTTPQSR